MEQRKVPLTMSRDCKYGPFRLEFVQSGPTFVSLSRHFHVLVNISEAGFQRR